MKLSSHIIASTTVAGITYSITHSWSMIIGILIAGVLVDLDHIIEFWYDCGINIDISKFFKYGYSGTNTRQFILLHSYEIIFFLIVYANASLYPYFYWGLSVGLLVHLLLDYVNIVQRLHYRWYSFLIFSLIFRMIFKFNRDEIDAVLRHTVFHEHSL